MKLTSAGRAVLNLKAAWARSRPAPGIPGTIGRVIAELERLNQSTEQDFLAVGAKLSEFRASARQISSDMAAIIELISGEQGRDASQALEQLLEHSRLMDADIERSGRAFASMRELSQRLRKGFVGLPNMVAMFRSLCTLTQIETARLGGAGADLGHLAAEIRPLSESIQASGETVVASSNLLDQAVARAMRSGSEFRARQLREMPLLIASVRAGLESFEERRSVAFETSARQAAEYAAVSEAVDDLVGSIQFHDITRQQLEHVLEALRHFSSGMRGAGYSSLETRTLLTLQGSQLAEAARLFGQSMERMDRDLDNIARRLQNASHAMRELAGAPGEGRESFFQKMEAQFAAILKLLAACTAAQRDIESAAGGLAGNIAGMRTSVGEIRATEIQIQRISTNATIRAIHIGVSGVALNKIAEVMQRLALESNNSTEEVATALDALNEASGRIAESPDGSATPDAEAIDRALAGLHTSRESSAQRVEQVAETGKHLAGEIASLRARISAAGMFADVVGRARAQLESLGAEAGEQTSEDPTAAGMQHLQHLAKTYTMQTQRDVHAAVVNAVPAPATRAEPKVPAGENDLGDNVDLF